MCDTQNNYILPENADKVLFAEDFMNHMLLLFDLPSLSSEIAVHRNSIHNAFNTQVIRAANFVYEELEGEMAKEFEEILNSNTKDINDFSKYATSLRDHTLKLMLPGPHGARVLIKFCVKISTLAGKFYMSGFQDAPRLAVGYIISLINDIDMLEGGRWEALNSVADYYSQDVMDTANNYSTTDNSDSNLLTSDIHTSDHFTSGPSGKDNSEDSRSPAHEMDVRYDHDQKPKTLIVGDFCEMCSSEDSRSPDHAMAVGVDKNEEPKELTNNDLCKKCIAAMSSLSEGPASSSSICNHVEMTIEVKSENTVSSSDNTSDSVSSGSPKETSSDDDTSKQDTKKENEES